ncbi:major histocompatibility complex class I-related gene protein-like [Aquarana catesbeiana]|uniref:major histocompatibility complex class I-related gene protein-like n=1 Tax=Aquarana catesbeiana TaxID=8400 RepID=UPI003CC9349A
MSGFLWLLYRMFHSLILFSHAGVILLVSCLSVCTVHADSHVLQYYFTALKKSGEPLHWYSIVGVMDGLQLAKYKSDTQKVDSQYVWMKDSREPQMWEKNVTQLAHKYEQAHRNTLQRIERMFNQSVDFHTYQIKFECVYYEDCSIGGHTEFGYNGRELVFFDKQALKYFPAVEKAQILTQEWNRDQQTTRADKEFSEENCVEWINKYRKHVKEELKTNVPPEVKVWGRHRSDGMTRLQCLVYGFHPRSVEVKWVRNGEDHLPSDEHTPILPHPDGTYQIRVSVEVLVSNDTYSCHVEHRSLEKTLIVNLNEMELEGFLDQHHLPISIYQRSRTIGFSLLAFSFLAITFFMCVYFFLVR